MKTRTYLTFGFAFGLLFGRLVRKRRARMRLGFGNYDAWQSFNEQFPCFVRIHPALQELRDKVFVGQFEVRHHADHIIFGLGRVCVEDFEQILNLCGNGFGIGALQMVRSLYERQITAAFISKYPEEVDAFTDYDAIHTRKLVEQFRTVYKNEPAILNSIVSEEDQASIEERYKEVKKRFMKIKCEECQSEELMFSWHRLDVGAMAGKGEQPA